MKFTQSLLLILILLSCSTNEKKHNTYTTPYLGEEPPGLKSKIFAPGIISTNFNERSLVFSPDGKELFF